MLTALLDAIGSWPAALVLAVAAVVLTLESGVVAGVVLPGSTMLVALGVWSAASDTPAVLPIVVAAAASVLGALTGWGRGHSRRSTAPAHRWLRARVDPAVRRARAWLSSQGTAGTAALLAVAHWAAVTSTLVPRVAGGAGVPLRLAAPAITLSGTAWAATVVLLARALGEQVAAQAGWVPAVALGALAVAAVGRHWWRVRHARQHEVVG